MKKRITILTLATIIIGNIFWRSIFVCNGEKLENVIYKSENLIIQDVQNGNGDLVIIGSGYSLSINEQHKIIKHDPLMALPNVDCEDVTIMSIYYPFESNGLEEAGKELSTFINQRRCEYDSITLIGHSKCGVCFANAAKWIKYEDLNVVTISTSFEGTPIADEQEMSAKLNRFMKLTYKLIFSDHAVDKDLITDSEFMQNADYSGLERCTHINIVSTCPNKSTNPIDVFLMCLDKSAGIDGDGIVPKASQQSLSYPNTIEIEIEATHATSMNKGVEEAKKYLRKKTES